VDGYGLVALIFAREVSDPLISLVKVIDKQLEMSALSRQCREKPGVHVVFCSDDPGLKQRLDALIAREGIKHIVLSVSKNKAQGPPRYRIAREAELTVVIFKDEEEVVANYVLDSIDLTADRGDEIMKALKKVLPSRP
jgi:hypothetical protein